MRSHGSHLALWIRRCGSRLFVENSHGCERRNNIFLYSRTSVLVISFEFLLRTQVALVHLIFLEAWTPINTWESWSRFWTQFFPLHPIVTFLGVGTLRLTAGRHRHSTATAVGGDLQWQSSKWTITYLVDILMCPGAEVGISNYLRGDKTSL